MSIDDPDTFELDEEEFDPDPFGFDRPPKPPRGRAKNSPHGDPGPGQSKAHDAAGFDRNGTDVGGDSQSAQKNSCFSVPKPWPDTQRAAPSELLRCSLFRPMRRGGREFTMKRLDTNTNVTLDVSGPELSEFDLETWLTVVHLLRSGPAELRRWSLLATSPRARGANGSLENPHAAWDSRGCLVAPP